MAVSIAPYPKALRRFTIKVKKKKKGKGTAQLPHAFEDRNDKVWSTFACAMLNMLDIQGREVQLYSLHRPSTPCIVA